MLVKANSVGFFDGQLRKAGDIFNIPSKKELGSWMDVAQQPKKSRKKRKAIEESGG